MDHKLGYGYKGFLTNICHNLTQGGDFLGYHAQPFMYDMIYATLYIIFSSLILKGLAYY
jgi:hypothetical protein